MPHPAALGQSTLAARLNYMGTAPRRRSTKRRKKSAAAAPRKRKRAGNKRARLVKGSAAAKAYMAKIRRKRR